MATEFLQIVCGLIRNSRYAAPVTKGCSPIKSFAPPLCARTYYDLCTHAYYAALHYAPMHTTSLCTHAYVLRYLLTTAKPRARPHNPCDTLSERARFGDRERSRPQSRWLRRARAIAVH
jgi:hypothetical protein